MSSKSYRKNIQWSFVGSLATAIFQFAQMAVFARLSGPAALGDYALAATVIGFSTTIAEAGLPQSIVQADKIGRIALKKLAWISILIGLLIFACLYFLGPVFARWYGSQALPGLLLLMGATLLFSPLGAQRSALLRKTLRFNTLAKIEVISWTISFLVTSVLAFQSWNAWAMAMGFFSRNIVLTIASLICTPHKEEHEAATPDISAHLRYGFFDFTAHWAEFLANYLDKLIVGKWLGMEALGYYNLAFTFLMLPTARLASVVTRVSFPVFAQIKSKKRALQAFFEKSTRDISLVLFPVYAVLILFPEEIILLIYGQKWLPAVPLFVAFGFAGWVRTLSTPFPQLMRGLGKPQLWMGWLLVFTLTLNAILCLVLWKNPELVAAAWTRTAVKFIVEIPMLWILARIVGLQFGPIMTDAAKWLIALSPVMLATWLTGLIPGSFWIVFVLKALVFMAGLTWVAFAGPLRKRPES